MPLTATTRSLSWVAWTALWLVAACKPGADPGAATAAETSASDSSTSPHAPASASSNDSESSASEVGSEASSSGEATNPDPSTTGDQSSTRSEGTSESTETTQDPGDSTEEATTESEPRPVVTAEPGTDLVKIDPSIRHQTFEGWGTSLCWWAHHVGGWDEAQRDAVVAAVVDPVDGLGYNIFRYNIGGGENPSHEHMREHREMPGFQLADGTWTWEADANQRAILLSIAAQGSDLILEAFSNSPPYWMTRSGCASGSSDGSNNLNEDAYGDFAHYLTEVVLHYRDTYGVTFRTLEPLNEPFATWWRADGSQEGCHFDPQSQERIIQEVARQLAEKGLSETIVSAADENSMDDALANLRGFGEDTLAVVGQINVHSYAGSRRRELRALANELDKPLWQSESGPLGQDITDDTDAALFMAERIIQDLRELEAEAWLDWQSGDPSRSWASFTLNDQQQTHSPIKRFYMHAGFSRYIRPGSVFVDVDHPDMVAAIHPDGDSLALVVRNGNTREAKGFTFDLTALPSVGAAAELYRTSRTEDLARLPPAEIDGYRIVTDVPAYSVSTFVIPMPR